jgi:hypothetical protein
MRDSKGRWQKDTCYPESSDLSSGLRIQEDRSTTGRRRLVTTYRGIPFRFYPESKKSYFAGIVSGSYKELHKYIWECEVGPVLSGHHVHHKDSDPTNNDVSNLECISASEHVYRHKMWLIQKPIRSCKCVVCGKEYGSTQAGHSLTCSRICANRMQYEKGNKVIYDRSCPHCGKEFRTAKKASIYCSISCSKKVYWSLNALAEKPCEWCGESFKPKTKRLRFCCRRCGICFVHAARKDARLQS